MNGIALRAALLVLIFAGSSAMARAQNRARPLDGESRRPTVSPYMNLINNQQGGATNYQSLVRPQLDQQKLNRKQSAAINQLRQASASAPATSRSSPYGSNGNLRSTGHRTTFNEVSKFYPGMRP